AGGASVLGMANGEKFKIGERNAEAIKERLKRHGLTPVASDLGGAKGRTLEVHPSSGKTFVRTAASAAIELQGGSQCP
ncbi:MAG: chemotaxis protein CheD, partial [Tepidiformaceae bacterium]